MCAFDRNTSAERYQNFTEEGKEKKCNKNFSEEQKQKLIKYRKIIIYHIRNNY